MNIFVFLMSTAGIHIIEKLEEFKELAESNDIEEGKAKMVLRELKIMMMRSGFMSVDCRELRLADRVAFREILELSSILSVRTDNLNEVKNSYCQLSYFYFDAANTPTSQRMFMIIALNLLIDLVLGNHEEYSTKLIQVQTHFKEPDFYVQYVLDIECCIHDSSLARLFDLLLKSPSSLFDRFIHHLIGTTRRQLASNIRSHSEYLTIEHLAKLLYFEDYTETLEFIASMGWRVRDNGCIESHEKQPKLGAKSSRRRFDHAVAYAIRFNSLM